ncbi:pirin family protein [Kitasatospora aburaviensis]
MTDAPARPRADLRRTAERYLSTPAEGIETRHAFSFAGHYDPRNTHFGALLACNEELLAPGAGFDEHRHRDTEILTWVLEGALAHRDSRGHSGVVRPGMLQHLSAGSGVTHTERNVGGAGGRSASSRCGSSRTPSTRPRRTDCAGWSARPAG